MDPHDDRDRTLQVGELGRDRLLGLGQDKREPLEPVAPATQSGCEQEQYKLNSGASAMACWDHLVCLRKGLGSTRKSAATRAVTIPQLSIQRQMANDLEAPRHNEERENAHHDSVWRNSIPIDPPDFAADQHREGQQHA